VGILMAGPAKSNDVARIQPAFIGPNIAHSLIVLPDPRSKRISFLYCGGTCRHSGLERNSVQ
jgi:hypothetical protein